MPAKGNIPQLGHWKDDILATPAVERAARKAELLAHHHGNNKRWTVDGVDFHLTRKPVLDAFDRLEVWVEAFESAPPKNPLPLDNPYLFVNPPILVPDGTFHDEIDPDTNLVYPVANFTEGADLSFQTMVSEAVFSVARRRGWTP